MANNKIIIDIVLDDKGRLVKATNQVKNLRQESDRLNNSQTSLGRSAEGYNKASRDSSVYHARNARDMKTLREEIGSGNNGLVGAYATLAVNTFAVVAAFSALQRATSALKVMAGLEAQGGRLGRTLSITSEGIREITNNALSMADAMKSTAQLTAGGFNDTQIKSLAKVAKDASGALGRDLNDSMDRLSRGVTKLEPELLDELGIMTKLDEATNLYATKINKTAASLTSAEKRQAFMNAVLVEGQRKFGGIGDQVSEYDAYTRLAASATDIFNSAVGSLAMGLAPIAEFFAANKGMIVGALLLYASTIRKDLLPALAQAAEKQREIANAKTAKQMESFIDFSDFENELSDSVKTGPFQPEVVRATADTLDDISKKLANNTLQTRDIAEAQTSVNSLIEEQKSKIASVDANNTKRYNRELGYLRRLQEAEQTLTELRKARGASMLADSKADLYDRAAGTSNPLNLNLRESFKGIREAAVEAQGGLVNTDNLQGFDRLSARLQNVRTSFSAVGQAAGAAMKSIAIVGLNALPIIGQITFAITILKAAWDALYDLFTTDAQKHANKVQEEYNTILDASIEKQAAYNRLVEAGDNKSIVDAIVIRGNAVKELTDKYQELLDVQKAASESSLLDKFKNLATGNSANVGSESIEKALSNTANSLAPTRIADYFSGEYTNALKGIKSIYGQLNKSGRDFIDLEVDKVDKLETSEERIAGVNRVMKELETKYGTLILANENLSEAFKNLEESTTKFIQAATISTPVDGIMKSMQQVTSAVIGLDIEMAKGSISTSEYTASLMQLGQQSKGYLGDLIGVYAQLDAARATYDEAQARGDNGAEQLTRLRTIYALEKQITDEMPKRLEAAQGLVRANQEQLRGLKAQEGLEAAIFGRISDQLDIGAEGYLARVKHEEDVRAFKVAELRIQQSLLKAFAQQANLQIEMLENQKKQVDAKLLELKTTQQMLEAQTKLSIVINNPQTTWLDQFRSLYEDTRAQDNIKELEIESLSLAKGIADASNAAQDLNDSISSIDVQITTLLAQNMSEAEKAARAAGEEFKVTKEYFEQAAKYANTLTDINIAIAKYNNLVTGTRSEFIDQYNEIIDSYKKARKSALDSLALRMKEIGVSQDIVEANEGISSLNAEQVAALARKGDYLTANYLNIQTETEALLLQEEITMRMKAAELAIYDNRKEGLEWQKQALDMYQKRADLIQEAYENEVKLAKSVRDAARARSVLGETDQSKKNDDIIDAAQALTIYKTSYDIRVKGIEAEYALLEAQRTMLYEELSARKQMLAALGASPEYLEPITRAISNIGAIDYSSLEKIAKGNLDKEGEILSANVETAIAKAGQTTVDNVFTRMAQALRDERQKQEAIEAARRAQAMDIPRSTAAGVVQGIRDSGIKPMLDAQGKALTPVLEKVESPLVQISTDVSAIRAAVTGNGSSYSLSANASKMEKDIFAFLKEKGVSDIHALGMMANIKAESGFRPGSDVIDSNGLRSSGLFQHNGARGDAMRAYAGSDWATDWKSQIEYALREADTKKYLSMSFPSPEESSKWFTINWERPADKFNEATKRLNYFAGKTVSTVEAATQTATSDTQGQQREVYVDRDRLEKKYEDKSLTRITPVSSSETGPLDVGGMDSLRAIENWVPNMKTGFQVAMGEMSEEAQKFGERFETSMGPLRELAESLGPEGELILAISSGVSTMTSSLTFAFEQLSQHSIGSTEGIQAMLSVASAAVSTISSILAAASERKIRAIEQEIAAEQKRDGQSAASVAKIAEMEKRKEAIARKQFNTNKKMMMAQAVIATATGVTQALSLPWPMNLIMAGIIGAMGAAQLAIIASTQYQGGSAANAGKVSIPKMSIGRVGDKVNLDRTNVNAGGEIGYLRGSPGYGTNANNYMTIGSAYGGSSTRGYGHRSMLVGEKGPETVETYEGMNIKPLEDKPVKEGDHFYIQATDADSFMNMLEKNPEAIAKGLRRLANSNGTPFLESVDLRGFKATKR